MKILKSYGMTMTHTDESTSEKQKVEVENLIFGLQGDINTRSR